QGESYKVKVSDPLFRTIEATYGYTAASQTAFIEMAQASGLMLLQPEEQNPLYTSTLGTGELICDALERGAKTIVLGLGGSATNDMGIGMAQALGIRFLDNAGKPLFPTGENLARIANIDISNKNTLINKVKFIVAQDVDNPLLGEKGAAQVYAQQKGASKAAIRQLEEGLAHLSLLVEQQLGKAVSHIPGAGAAGGLGAGAIAFLEATTKRGIDLVMALTDFDTHVRQCDYLITGEGKLDEQTLQGKTIAGVCQRARKHQKPVIAFGGTLALTPNHFEALGLAFADAIVVAPCTLEEALQQAAYNLEQAAYRVGKWLCRD
ncbi:MAG: glycerate kinase, partial [Bacteroidota bacterium]